MIKMESMTKLIFFVHKPIKQYAIFLETDVFFPKISLFLPQRIVNEPK